MSYDYTTILHPNGAVAWKRDGAHLRSLIKTMPDGRVVTLKDLSIVFPEDYLEKSLCKYGKRIEILGILAFLDPEKQTYAVFNIPVMIYLNPTDTKDILLNEVPYKVLEYQKGQVCMLSDKVIGNAKMAYWMYDYFISLGRVPWYLSYLDILNLYRQDKHYHDAVLSKNIQVIDMVYSAIARQQGNDRLMYRMALKSMDDLQRYQPQWVPLKSVSLGAVDTMSKIMGAYYDEGVNSALAEPSKKLTEMEKILRA